MYIRPNVFNVTAGNCTGHGTSVTSPVVMLTDEIGSTVPSTGKQSTRVEYGIVTCAAVQPATLLEPVSVSCGLTATVATLPGPPTATTAPDQSMDIERGVNVPMLRVVCS